MNLPWLLAALVVALPFAAVAPLLALGGINRAPSERTVARVVLGLCGLSSLAAIALAVSWFAGGGASMDLRYGSMFDLGPRGHAFTHSDAEGYRFEVGLLVDRLSVTMMLLTSGLSWIVARFSVRYLHREAGFFRYFLLMALFTGGMQVLVLAGSFDLMFVGWELVGVSSMLLIAFFHLRRGPAQGALRAMLTYRVTDVGLLVGAVLLHHFARSSELADAFGHHPWPRGVTHLAPGPAALVLSALLFAAVGKSALFPLGTWLPRAMEGPTPSSALFYGGLAVHAGVYLMLRSAPLLEASKLASALVGAVGVLTAGWATLAGRTRSDVKSSLAYATITQVGWMFVGLSLHWWNLVLAYVVAHACLRTLQLLRAPSALHDAEAIRAALDTHAARRTSPWRRVLPESVIDRLYAAALEDFQLDAMVSRFVIAPALSLSRAADRLERWWVGLLSGGDSAADADGRVDPRDKRDAPRDKRVDPRGDGVSEARSRR
jgi:NADH-quinone oxidoreductase subunit L